MESRPHTNATETQAEKVILELVFNESRNGADKDLLRSFNESLTLPKISQEDAKMICSIAEKCFQHNSTEVAHAALDCFRRWKPMVRKQQQQQRGGDGGGQMWPQQTTMSNSRSGNNNNSTTAGGGRQRKQQQQQRDKSESAAVVGDINLVIQQTLAMKSNPIVQRQIEEEDRRQMLEENKMMNSHR
eukprot:GHVS01071941.1.p1 GENE.GHVS01071941.1~~GHVS01071941.1.p1  ORF type:complete len:187 (+),score=53.51 GHVS01071941.1:209-769(+)